MIRIVGAVSDLQQPPCPDFSRRRYSIDQIEIYIPFVPIYDQQFDFSPQLTPFVPINGTSHDLSNLAFERIPLRQSRARLYGRWSVAWPDPADRAARRTLRRARAIRDCASVKYSFPNGVAIDRPLPGLTIVASALNANNQAGARIPAVHLQIPNLPSLAARDAMIAEDALIKYARDGGGASDWNPDLHPRTGTPPNSGWFATTGGHREEPGQDESSSSQSRLRIAANEDGPMRTDATSSADDQQTLQPGNPIDEPANLTDRPDWNHFWSDTWPAIKDWLEEPVPEYDIESGQAVGERPRWRRLISAFPPRLRRPLVSRLLRQRSQHGLASMLLKHPSSQIPDALTDTASIEIKDAAYVSATRQLRIQAEAAKTLGRESILITGSKTKISRQIWKLFKPIIRRSDLGPQ